jgi:hypothetical protein
MGESSIGSSLVFDGSHGTLRSSVHSIENNGFNPSKQGRLGVGAYFWKECAFWIELAIAWVRMGYSNSYERRIGGIVLFCKINTNSNNHLNIDQPEFRDKLLKQAKKRNLNFSEKEISQLHDSIITEMEQRKGSKYEVIEGAVQPPPKDFFKDSIPYPVTVAGLPICLLVRNNACIKIYDKIQFDI